MLDFFKPLPPSIKSQSSNYRELFAINQAIAHFSNSIRNQEIRSLLIRSDNTTAVFNLNRWGAGPNLRTLLKRIWNQTQVLKVVVKAQHIPGERNVRADGLSRLAVGGDNKVEQEALEEITNQLQMHITLDAFATKKKLKINEMERTRKQLKSRRVSNFLEKQDKSCASTSSFDSSSDPKSHDGECSSSSSSSRLERSDMGISPEQHKSHLLDMKENEGDYQGMWIDKANECNASSRKTEDMPSQSITEKGESCWNEIFVSSNM
ncbi:uncharacterized protein MONOS_13658 [Monocercomonoides exilis]|uniref:uncharacterized protein n=1 Tax=Monocercomonoides exilis TaxID=2049356 RepID=UPI00355A3D7C|nr:hypothetical protein MONOS_13658 [Monocercomonoides exilis]|eukprot:MONOS_13658.1-p1 / transcript=MONOS_13658.1 / gene=MONOS_13658 / organism=Monocercomonoides_exilis_PA203 / gene_product=unspecified product / transcript_product=unspecified product / location=Mono_scaffold00859:17146-17937(-) / protein_length=264 / sequence_SO=supercontig / SO=protein_coding / is_pseudo=false